MRITYADELLADNTVHRRYSDGREEWRTRTGRTVTWRDSRGGSGVDEPLGPKLVKRTHTDGRVVYGREGGYGRTLWGDGVVTVNRTSFGGRVGAVLGAVAGGALLATMVAPPMSLSPEEEEQLRQQAQESSGGGGGDGGSYGGDWDSDDTTIDDDFG